MAKKREFTLATLNRIVDGLLAVADDIEGVPVRAEYRNRVLDIIGHIRRAANQLTPWTTIQGREREER